MFTLLKKSSFGFSIKVVTQTGRLTRLEDHLCTIIFKPSQANFGTSFGEKWVHLAGLAFLRHLVNMFL